MRTERRTAPQGPPLAKRTHARPAPSGADEFERPKTDTLPISSACVPSANYTRPGRPLYLGRCSKIVCVRITAPPLAMRW